MSLLRVHEQESTAIAVAWTIFEGDDFEIRRLHLKIDVAPTTSENLTLTVDSVLGAAYDTEILSIDLIGKTDVVITDIAGLLNGDKLIVAYTNTDTKNITGAAAVETLNEGFSGGLTNMMVLLDGEVVGGGSAGQPTIVGAVARAAEEAAVAAGTPVPLTTDLFKQLVPANFVWADRSGATTETDPSSTHYLPESTTSTGAVANATPYDQIIAMDGYRGCEVQIEVTTAGVGDTFAVTYLASVEGVDAGDAWLDSTTNGWNLVAGASLAVDHIMASEPFHVPRGHLVRITTAGANDDMEFDVHVKALY